MDGGALRMPTAEYQAILDAVRDVGARVDALRLDVFRALAKHDDRIRALELTDERERGAAEERDRQANQRVALALSRRGWVAVAITGASVVFGALMKVLDVVGGR